MRTRPVAAARIGRDADGWPYAIDYGDVYHPRIGAPAQAAHVFLAGNGLPGRWQGRERFAILETGFGFGLNFLATWQAWRADERRCARLTYVAIEAHPPAIEDRRRLLADSPWPELASALLAAWPPATPNLHAIDLDGGAVRLLLGFGDVGALLPELSLHADAFYLDGFAPSRNPAMWELRVLKALGRRAAAGATAATWSAARALREGLATAGFDVEAMPGIGGKREGTRARFAPRFAPPSLAGRGAGRATVLGAGLAGAFAARALADDGWSVTVIDRAGTCAAATSGNAGGLFHGTVHADDGPHARLLRAGALFAARTIAPLVAAGEVGGRVDGLLRLGGRPLHAMQAMADRQGLPADWVQVLDAEAARARAGVPLPGAAWLYPGAGWASPAELVRWALRHDDIEFRGGIQATRLAGADGGWHVVDDRGRSVAAADIVVLAAGASLQHIAGAAADDWPLTLSRGQVSRFAAPGHALQCPVAGDGYALPLSADELLCGATASHDDDPGVREADHRHNLERLRRLTGLVAPDDPAAWQGRVGFRLVAADRLPIAGALPACGAGADDLRRWPRQPGLFVLGALAGRGITLAPLLGRLVAARAVGDPLPLEQDLVDAIDPARWAQRARRRRYEA